MSSMPQQLRLRSADGPTSALRTIEERVGLTPAGLSLIALCVVGWIAARILGSRVTFLLVYGALFVLLIAWISGRRKPAAKVERSDLPTRVREGQTVSVDLVIIGSRRMGGLILEERIPSLVGRPVSIPVTSLSPGKVIEHSYSFIPRLRGVYDIGPLSAVWSDPFGLTRRRTPLLGPATIIVHPSTEAVHDRVLSREWEDPPVRPPVSKPWPTGFEFYGMRDYVPGDDPRRIVWRAVARTGRYLVREAEQGITDRVMLIIDTDLAHHAKAVPSDTFEASIRAAASLGVRHLKDGFAVTLESSQGRVADGLRGQRMQMAFLDKLARMQPGSSPLVEALGRVLVEPRRDMHNILITPHLDDKAAGILKLLMQRGASVLFVRIVGEEPDRETLDRAAAMGCQVVELRPGVPLETVFARAVGAGLRR